VILTQKALAQYPEGIEVLVDNTTSRDNIIRFGKNKGYQVKVEPEGSDFRMILVR